MQIKDMIKKCPFCGSEAILERQPLAYAHFDGWAVQCTNEECYAASTGLVWPSQDGAITAWNTRENKELSEKQEPKSPKVDKRKYSEDYICPCCNHRFISKDETGWFAGMRQKFCPDCGQAIDWEN